MTCRNCPIRKYYAKMFDIHFDEKDCGLKCPEKEGEKNEGINKKKKSRTTP
mgnify:CR=1 FL=1